MKKFLLSFLCFLMAVASGFADKVTDELTLSTTGMSGTVYGSWSGKTVNSDAVYAGQSAGDKNSIQLRSKNSNSGIVSTTSGGKVKTITVVWNSGTTSGRILDVYGKNSAYSSPTELYNTSTQGTKLGSIKYGTSTELTIEGDYEYIGLRSNSGAMYLTSISITWENGESGSGEMQKPSTPSLLESKTFVESMDVEITCATEGAYIYYTTDGTIPTSKSNKYLGSFNITDTKTINAVAINEAGSSSMATATYTRVAESPEILFDGESTFEGSKEVTVTIPTGTTVYYTLNGKTPTKDSDECPETLTLKADATLQVIAFDEDGYASPVVKQAFKQTVSSVGGASTGTATLVTDKTNLAVGDKVVIVASGSDMALSTEQKNNNRGVIGVTKSGNDVVLKAGETSDVQRLTLEKGTVDGTYAFYTGSGYLYAASSSYNYLRTQDTNDANSSWKIDIATTGVATIKAKGEYENNWLRYNSSSNPNLFSCYGPNNTQKDVSLYKVIKDYVLNVTEAGWATLYFDYAVTIPEGVICYVVSGVGEESVQLTEVTGVLPANTAVIVNANKGGYTFEGTEKTAAVESIMDGSVENKYIAEEAYVLGMVDGEIGLYKTEMNGGVFLNNANKAYLPATAVPSNTKALKFNFDTTGVEGVKVETVGKKVIFDLSGRRVNDVTAPGLYIVNGKKVMVK